MEKLQIKKQETVDKMVNEIIDYASRKDIELWDNIPFDVNDFDILFNDGGEARCEHFTDLAWDYAFQFGVIDDYDNKNGFEAHRWRCVESAMKILQKEYNKNVR
jgi:hypothetical protein